MNEKDKYTKAWDTGAEGQSKTAIPVFEFLKEKLDKNAKILDIGCGNGVVVELLKKEGFTNVVGVDITLEGLKLKSPNVHYRKQNLYNFQPDLNNYVESSITETPFKDDEFDFTFSVDMLEHLPPEEVSKAIKEIYRITKKETYHCIATFEDNRKGFQFHLSVHPIEWWRKEFEKYNDKNTMTVLIDRKDFLT